MPEHPTKKRRSSSSLALVAVRLVLLQLLPHFYRANAFIFAPKAPILDSKKELLNSLLEGTFLEKDLPSGNVKCVYKASKDGWSAIDFHKAVDGKGCALAVAMTPTGTLFGGFNPSGWSGTDDYYLSNNAFLWYAKPSLFGGEKAIKCKILPGGNAAVYDYATGDFLFILL